MVFFHSNYKLTLGASGITFTGINPNKTFHQKTIANVQEGGLRLQNETLDLTLFSKMDFTISPAIWCKKKT